MRLELLTKTAVFAIELPDERYDILVKAFQAHLAKVEETDELDYGIHAMLADHYEKEIAMQCPASVVCEWEDLPF
jgi:hypothetical protein